MLTMVNDMTAVVNERKDDAAGVLFCLSVLVG